MSGIEYAGESGVMCCDHNIDSLAALCANDEAWDNAVSVVKIPRAPGKVKPKTCDFERAARGDVGVIRLLKISGPRNDRQKD